MGVQIKFNEKHKSNIKKNINESISINDSLGSNKSTSKLGLELDEKDSFNSESQVAKFDKIECVCDSCTPFVADEVYSDNANLISESVGIKLIKKGWIWWVLK